MLSSEQTVNGSAIHTSGELHEDDGTAVVTVTLATVDAYSVGLTLRAMARNSKMPADVRERYNTVGSQLEAAGKANLRRAR